MRAKAWKKGWTPSTVQNGTYTITGAVATPEFSPNPGTYTSAQDVTITCATPGAVIRYTTNDTEPTDSSAQYVEPVSISGTTKLKAKAWKEGWTPSTIQSGTYNITGAVATPEFSPNPGTYTSAQDVTITCATSGTVIRYTTNDTEPTESSTQYVGPVSINGTTTLKAKAWKEGWEPSDVQSGQYTITGTVAMPQFSPSPGTYTSPQSVTISCSTSGAIIRYTINGTEPTQSSMQYGTPISISSTTALKAKAWKLSWTPSAVQSGTYIIGATEGEWLPAKTEGTKWSARWGHTSVTHNGEIWVMGGVSGGYTEKNDVWHSSDGVTWTGTEASWPVRYSHASVEYSGKLWIFGGYKAAETRYAANTFYNDVWSSSDGKTWVPVPAKTTLWTARNGFQVVVFNGEMWLVGGYDRNGTKNDVWSSSDGATWTEETKSAAWSARYGHSVAVFGNKMWLLGGYNKEGSKNDVWSSSNGTTWVPEKTANWSARFNAGCVVTSSGIWVLGGTEGSKDLNDVWFSSDGTVWTSVTNAAEWLARSSFGAVMLNNDLFVLGGYSDKHVPLNDVWYLETK